MGKRTKKKGGTAAKRAELEKTVRECALLTSKTYMEEKNSAATYQKLQPIISSIIHLERELGAGAEPLSDGPRSKQFPLLIDWVKSNGGEIDGVSVHHFPDTGYGLLAETSTEEGARVCSIPRKVMMIVEEGDPDLAELVKSDPMLRHMSNVALALYLIFELSKGKESFYAPYIASLPQTYNTVLYFTAAEMAKLKGSPVHESAMLQNIHIGRQYAYFYDLFHKSTNPASQRLKDIFTFQLYRWAVSTVVTRQNMIPCLGADDADMESERKVPALIPVWDMCNHTPGPVTTGYNKDTACCECYSLHPLVPQHQILIAYGSRSNSEYFLHNGFVQGDNVTDTYRIHVGLAKSDPLAQLRSQLLTRLSLPCGGDFYLKSPPGPVEDDLLAFIRVFSMDKGSLEHWLESTRWNDLKCMDCALDTQIETKAWNFLATRISLLLSVYPTHQHEKDGSEVVQLIKKLICEEKKLLNAARDYAKLKAEH